MHCEIIDDYLIYEPDNVELSKSPLRNGIDEPTYVLGVFNPGMERLPNGNIILMVRVAEALKENIKEEQYSYIKWNSKKGYEIAHVPLKDLDLSDPRKFIFKNNPNKAYCLSSFSWILPVEIDADAKGIVNVHYDKAVVPQNRNHEYGIEDARITKIDGKYYMTACAVSSFRHSTVLYKSEDGLNYKYIGVILDHQNKDMVLFPEKIGEYYYALTRPIGDHYFFADDKFVGPNIQMAKSPDLLHWAPVEKFHFDVDDSQKNILKLGGGAPPIKHNDSWLILFHLASRTNDIGEYKTYAAMLEGNDPSKIISIENESFLEYNPKLTDHLQNQKYLDDVVFTTGVIKSEGNYIVASGELDLCCRITKLKCD